MQKAKQYRKQHKTQNTQNGKYTYKTRKHTYEEY